MNGLRTVVLLGVALAVGASAGYWYARGPTVRSATINQAVAAAASGRTILYYRDPTGAPYWSATPKKNGEAQDYLPVYEDEEVSFDPGAPKPQPITSSSIP